MLGTEKLSTQWLRYPRPGGLRPLGLSASDHIHLAIHPHDSDTVCKSPGNAGAAHTLYVGGPSASNMQGL